MKPSNDKEAITLILQGLVNAGCTLIEVADDTWNMRDKTTVSTVSEAVDLVTGVDEAYVFVTLPPGSGRETSHVFFVLGNEPEEVASDYGVSLEPFIDPIVTPWWS